MNKIIKSDFIQNPKDKEFKSPEFLRLLAKDARREAEDLLHMAKDAEKRAKELELKSEAQELADDLTESFDQEKLEAFVEKQKARLKNSKRTR